MGIGWIGRVKSFGMAGAGVVGIKIMDGLLLFN
jgi:hypothetical protein